jgi:hypothetical protein
MTASNPFFAEALAANRAGELSTQQRENFEALSRYQRRNLLSMAAVFLALAAIIWFLASPTKITVVRRELYAGGALAIAAFLVMRSVSGSDALTRDLQESRVESVEGAIGKHRMSNGRAQSTYLLDVGDARFRVGSATYQAAPDAGWVRVFYLPLSRKVVNLEQVANASPAPEVTPPAILKSLASAFIPVGSRREMNEARAGFAKLGETLQAGFDGPAQAPPAEARDPRPLDKAVVGSWTNGFIHVTFSEDGRLTLKMFGNEKTGRWSVDAQGRLSADVMGQGQSAEAWVAGDQLTVTAQGKHLTFKREG